MGRVSQNSQEPREKQSSVRVSIHRPIKERLDPYFAVYAQTLVSSLGRLAKTPYSSIMTVTVISMALTMPSVFYLMVENFKQISGVVNTQHDISLFLKPKVSDETGRKIADELAAKHWVKRVELITKEQGLKEFESYSGFSDALSILEENPLPPVVRIQPKASHAELFELKRLTAEYNKIPEVDLVQIDLQWIERLRSIMNLANRSVLLFSLLLGLAVIFIVSNTLRLELQNRKDEIIVAKLVGATNSFIRRPLLCSGFWYGIISSLLALLLVSLVLNILEVPIDRLSSLYHSDFDLKGFDFKDSVVLIGISISLGVIGAWLTSGSHLRELKPD